MTKQYLILTIIGLIIAIYSFGFTRGNNKCITEITNQNTQIEQQKIITKEKINAEIYRTGVRDIRNILREKYTITD